MFPIRDHNPSQKTPYVTYGLIVINILIFLAGLPISQSPQALHQVYDVWAVIPVRIVEGSGHYTLISSAFLHGGWMHLIGNMLFLYVFGDNLEDRLGHVGYIAFYLTCGIFASLVQVWSAPDSIVPLIGASGAIAGVMGGYLLLYPKARVDVLFVIVIFFKIIPIPAWIVLGAWFGLQLFNGVGSSPTGGGVAYWAHAGGFVAGVLLIWPLWLRLGGRGFWKDIGGHPDHPEARYRRIRSPVPVTRGRARGKVVTTSGVPKVGRRRTTKGS